MGLDLSKINQEQEKKKSSNESDIIAFLNKDISLTKKKLTDKQKESFYSELGVLLSSGIDIKTTMEIIVEEQKSKFAKQTFSDVSKQIIEGSSLSESMINTELFTPHEINSIKIGEESGRLLEVLTNLSQFFNKSIKQKRQLTNAFSYPVIVIITAFLAIYFMLNFMVPMFEDVFERFNNELPKLTQKIIAISDFFSKYFLVFLLFIVVIVVGIMFSKKKVWYRSFSSKLLLKTPFIGKIFGLKYQIRFFEAMELLTGAKIPLLRSINLVRQMVGFYPFEFALKIVENDILHGMLLYESLSKFNIIDKKAISLVKVGEETNKLNYIFEKLNNQRSEELEFQIGMLSSLLEPFIIIFIGLLVGVILVSMYLPMFQMSTSIM